MSRNDQRESAAAAVAGTAAVLTGLGALGFALFPLAIPIVVLTGVFVGPMLLLGLPVILVGGLVYLAVRSLRRARLTTKAPETTSAVPTRAAGSINSSRKIAPSAIATIGRK